MSSNENFKSEDESVKLRDVKSNSSSPNTAWNKKDDNNVNNRKSRSKSRSISSKPKPSRNVFRRNNGNRIPEPCECIGVFGLSRSTTKEKLYEIFEKFGEIVLLNLLYDKNRNVSAGFAFITYKTIEVATKAKDECNEMNVDGNRIRVDYSLVKKAYSPTPGVYKGKASGVRNTNFRSSRRDEGDNRYRDRNFHCNERDSRRNYDCTRDAYRNHRLDKDRESSDRRHRKYQDRSSERNIKSQKYKRDSDTEYRNRKVNNYDHKYKEDKEFKYKNLKDGYSRKRERSHERISSRYSGDDRVNKYKRKYSRSRSPVDRKYRRYD